VAYSSASSRCPDRSDPTALARFLESPIFMRVGIISGSVFLWHEPLIRWLSTHGLTLGRIFGFGVNLVMLATLTGVLSTLTYQYVERPALRRKTHSTIRVAGTATSLLESPDAFAPVLKRP
jgi:peptidoglycan/LPS O-acetylase OafA/YrhL